MKPHKYLWISSNPVLSLLLGLPTDSSMLQICTVHPPCARNSSGHLGQTCFLHLENQSAWGRQKINNQKLDKNIISDGAKCWKKIEQVKGQSSLAILFPLHRMPCRHCGTLTFQDPLQMIPSVKSSRLTIKFNHGLSRLSHWLSKSICGTEDKCSVLLLVALSKPLSTLKKSSLDILQRRADTITLRNCLMCQFVSGKSSRGERKEREQTSWNLYRGQRNNLPNKWQNETSALCIWVFLAGGTLVLFSRKSPRRLPAGSWLSGSYWNEGPVH